MSIFPSLLPPQPFTPPLPYLKGEKNRARFKCGEETEVTAVKPGHVVIFTSSVVQTTFMFCLCSGIIMDGS